MVLLRILIVVPDPTHEIAIFVHPFDPPSYHDPESGYPITTPAYQYGFNGRESLRWASGCETEPAALVNDDGIDTPWEWDGLPLAVSESSAGSQRLINPLQNTGEFALSGRFDDSDGYHFRYLPPNDQPWVEDPQWFHLIPNAAMTILIEWIGGGTPQGYYTIEMCDLYASYIGNYPAGPCVAVPTELDFGAVAVGSEREIAFNVWNTSDETLVTVAEEEGADFAGDAPVVPPDDAAYGTIRFAPLMVGPQECLVTIESGGRYPCGEIVCTGSGYVPDPPEPEYRVTPRTLEFGAVALGSSAAAPFVITNIGNETLVFDITESCPDYAIDGITVFVVPPGEQREVDVVFTPRSYGWRTCEISLLDPDRIDVTCSGYGAAGPVAESDRIGIFFDPPDYLENDVTAPAHAVQEAYLVIKNPAWSGEVVGWEACAPILGENQVLGWSLAVPGSNAGTEPCFDVLFAEPLVPTPPHLLLATAEVLVVCDDCASDFYVHPPPNPEVPDQPAHLTDGGAIPLATITGQPWVAGINSSVVSLALPRPEAVVDGEAVRLSWPVPATFVDGFHVYRRGRGGGRKSA